MWFYDLKYIIYIMQVIINIEQCFLDNIGVKVLYKLQFP